MANHLSIKLKLFNLIHKVVTIATFKKVTILHTP